MERKFSVVLSWDEETQVYVVTVPALPGCVTQGKNKEEALEQAAEAIQVTLEGLAATGQPIPHGAGEASLNSGDGAILKGIPLNRPHRPPPLKHPA